MNKGFTFVETLVAIAVLLLAVAAPLSLASQGLATARSARQQVTALYLAQEAVEYARAVRDDNALSGLPWLTGLNPCVGGAACHIDVPQGTVAACGASGCPVLRIHPSAYLYGYNGSWEPTPFTRTMTLAETVPGQEAALAVTVSWREGRRTRSVAVDEQLLDWQ